MIGIFDSGVGGLSVLRSLRERMPHADVVYFGDIKHAPYGLRTEAELSKLTRDAIALLQARGATKIISACNSVSASLVVSLFDSLALSPEALIEMVGPTVAQFQDSTGRLALCATPATITSDIYQNAFTMLGKDVEYIAISELAGAIEFGMSETQIERIIRDAFPETSRGFDTLILSCTHYPLVKNVFERVLGTAITIFDPSVGVAEKAAITFREEATGTGRTHFIISQDSERFRVLVGEFFPKDTYSIEVTA